MTNEFTNNSTVVIEPGPPNTVVSSIDVQGLDNVVIQDIRVNLNINHTWTGDLSINLIHPSGQKLILVDRRGGYGNDFKDTVFAADAPDSIRNAIPPFEGNFQPEGDLAEFRNRPANGFWTLEVNDRAYQDGGAINQWGLIFDTKPIIEPSPPFQIEVRFIGGLSSAQQDAFSVAAQRWSEIIISDLPSANIHGEIIDDVVIEARGKTIDGTGGILGQAGPTWLRPGSLLPIWGIMSFDTADLAVMEENGSLVRVIMHEMAHVIGFGTIWSDLGLLQGAGTVNPVFVGENAMREYGNLKGESSPSAVPVANTGGPGTRDSHWREAIFVNELMTGWLGSGINPISKITIGSFEDLGYQVNYEAADSYDLPSALMPALMGMNALYGDHGGRGIILPTDHGVLPAGALISP